MEYETPLLNVVPPSCGPAKHLARCRGGFLWWYADIFDQRGNGAVLIWSFGLPFLPGYLQAGRRGRPEAPGDRPSLNLVLYRDGAEDFYLLQEYERDEVSWTEGRWRFGDTEIEVDQDDGQCRVEVRLDVPVPSIQDRLRGTLELTGALSKPASRGPGTSASATPAAEEHMWSLMTAMATGSARLLLGGRRYFHMEGHGYHDRNSSAKPLDALGIRHWIWGRAPFSNRELIYYLLWPTEAAQPANLMAFEHRRDGATRPVEHLEVQQLERRLGRYGMPWWERLVMTEAGQPLLDVRLQRPVDDGPFYLRAMSETRSPSGERGVGTVELCRPARVDQNWMRPLVRMRVHELGERNSPWLPLFSGPREGRVARQLRALASRAGLSSGLVASQRPFAGHPKPLA